MQFHSEIKIACKYKKTKTPNKIMKLGKSKYAMFNKILSSIKKYTIQHNVCKVAVDLSRR